MAKRHLSLKIPCRPTNRCHYAFKVCAAPSSQHQMGGRQIRNRPIQNEPEYHLTDKKQNRLRLPSHYVNLCFICFLFFFPFQEKTKTRTDVCLPPEGNSRLKSDVIGGQARATAAMAATSASPASSWKSPTSPPSFSEAKRCTVSTKERGTREDNALVFVLGRKKLILK